MFQRFFDEGLAQSSFLIACSRTRDAAAVDPRRDVDVYVAAARQHGLTIAYSIETHVHADFVSGSRELAARGARVIVGPGSGLKFPHHEAQNGERIMLGDIALTFLHTPGHTPEHISILVEEPGEPRRVLTGDTLFVGAVGRPDLLGAEQARGLANQLHDSLFNRLLSLADEVEVHPGHGAGSLCGAGIGKEPSSTIGQERRFNPMLQHRTRDTFVRAVLGDLPETPPYFPRMKRVNAEGPAVLGLAENVAPPPAIEVHRAAEVVRGGAILIDLRSADEYAAAHPTRAMHIGFGSKVGYWAGWVIPAGASVILLATDSGQALEAWRQLIRVGIDGVVGYVDGGFTAWQGEGLPVSQIAQVTVEQLVQRMSEPDAPAILDVRTAREFKEGHLEGAMLVPVGEVPARLAELPARRPIATICEAGYRSSLASSLLERAGIGPVINVVGGMSAFRALEATR